MEKKIYRYSVVWRTTFALTVPCAFSLILISLNSMGSSFHFRLGLTIIGISLIPYFFLVIKFMEKYIVTDTYITQKNYLVSRTLRWKAIIEYRDFFNMIVLLPLVVKNSINIFFYRNIKDYMGLRKYLSSSSVKYEANMMSRKRDRVFLIIDIGTTQALLVVLVPIIAVMLFRNSPLFDLRVLLIGAASGIFFILSSVSMWMALNDLTHRATEYGHVISTLMSVSLIVPIIVVAVPVSKTHGVQFATMLGTYFLGYLMGWGGMSAFFPNRSPKGPRDYPDKRHLK